VGRYGTKRVAKVVTINAIPPLMLKTASNPGGRPIEAFDKTRAAVRTDRASFFKELALPFYGANRSGAKIPAGILQAFWSQSMMTGYPACYTGIKAFSETDFTEDLKKIDVPMLIIQGDDDQNVPLADSAPLSAKLVKGSTLRVIPGAPHGMTATLKDQVNAELLAFIKL
jgi:non-heme chloroperoxidase